MTEPVVVKLSTRRDAKKYRVTYTDAGPRMVEVWEPTRSYNSHYVWKAIWNSDYPLEGKALDAVRVASRMRGL